MRIAWIILLFPVALWAQPDTLWTRTFDGGGDDYAEEALLTADGGVLLAGSAFGNESIDYRLIRTDGNGNVLWSHFYGTTRDDWISSIIPAVGGGWLLGGFTFPQGSFFPDMFFVRVNEAGDTLWTRRLGDLAVSESANSMVALPDGGFLIAGDMDDSQSGQGDIFLMRMNSGGDTWWARIYEFPEFVESAGSLCELTDGNLLIAGSQTTSSTDFYFMKVNAAGDTLWTRRYGGPGYDLVRQVKPLPDGGVIFTGLTDSYGGGDLYLARLDGAGDSVWAHTYGGTEEDHSHAVATTSDGGYLVCGHTTSFGAVSGDAYLVKTDSEGIQQWSFMYGGADYESFESVVQTGDGGVILSGNRSGAQYADMFLLRLENIESARSPEAVPDGFALYQNYPNPFNGSTTISFELAQPGPVRLSIYNLAGQDVSESYYPSMSAGAHKVSFEAGGLASGIYLCRIEQGNHIRQQKMVLLR